MTEQSPLLQTRYKVMIPYPLMLFKVGDILTRIKRATNDVYCKNGVQFEGLASNPTIGLEEILKCPEIFRPMEWWEDLRPEEMPKYVKSNISGGIYTKGGIYKCKWKSSMLQVRPYVSVPIIGPAFLFLFQTNME